MKSIKFENLTFGHEKNKPIFQNLSFEIGSSNEDKGHVVVLMGASGSGKSTLLKLILGTDIIQRGQITSIPNDPIIAYLPQEPILFEHLTPIQNARYFQHTASYKSRFDENLFQELVLSLNMEDVLTNSKSVLKLSGGQRQRLSLLRGLSIRPDFLFLDEPTTGLDAHVKIQFLNKLREIIIKYKLLTLYVTHHKLETELIADEVIYLSKNKETNTIDRIFQDSIVNFIHHPPILEAINVFTYPQHNILNCTIKDNEISFNHQNDEIVQINILSENIQLNDNGIDFSIVSLNPIFSTIEIVNKQYLIIKTEVLIPSKNKLVINGVIPYYQSNELKGILMIHKNKIIEKKYV